MTDLADALANEVVLVVDPSDLESGVLYPHTEFLGAFQEAMLDRLARLLPSGGCSQRAVFRVMAKMRTAEDHKATLADALVRLRASGNPVDPVELVEGARVLVATFPGCT